MNKYFLDKIEQLNNNKEIKQFLHEFNKSFYLSDDEILGYPIIENKLHLLMMQLGIPIGLIKPVDLNGNNVYEWMNIPSEQIRYEYTPINNFVDLELNIDSYDYLHFRVNPRFLSKDKIQHLAYCLEFSSNRDFFDIETMNKMQCELIDSCPLKYNDAMKIFNKYYTIDVQNKFIFDKGVNPDRFYEISGLKRINKNSLNQEFNIKI